MAMVRLFRREPEAEASNPIQFDPALVNLLKRDHRRLIRQLQQLRKSVVDGAYAKLPEQLAEFRSLLQTHLMTENVRLYGYLSYSLGTYSEDARRAAEFRREMYSLGHVAMTFVRRYLENPVDARQSPVFAEELMDLSVLLIRRIRREEGTLFPMYVPESGTRKSASVTPLSIVQP